jgi:PAS domain S-box-containing protein
LVARVEGVLRLAKLRREKSESERQIVERALGLTQDRLSLALESARMGTWDWEIATDELIWSPVSKSIFGMASDAPISYSIFLDVVHPEDREAVDALCRRCLDPTIRAPYDTQYRVVWPDGAVRWVLARGKAYFEDARAVRFAGTVIDLSDQKQAEAHLGVMVDELSHRVKNTLAVIQSITAQTVRGSTEISSIKEALEGRLQTLADTHTLLTLSHWESVDLASLVERSVGHLGQEGDAHFSMDGPEVGLTPKAALALGLVLHELAVNAAKYGAWAMEGGDVALAWRVIGDKLTLNWTESGLEGVKAPVRKGFGTRLMTQAVEYDLDGEASQVWRPQGLDYVLTVPVGRALASAEAVSS